MEGEGGEEDGTGEEGSSATKSMPRPKIAAAQAAAAALPQIGNKILNNFIDNTIIFKKIFLLSILRRNIPISKLFLMVII